MFAEDKSAILGCDGLQEVMGSFPDLHIHSSWVNVCCSVLALSFVK